MIKTITIYGASSSNIDPVYLQEAKKLGKLIFEHGIDCINGGGRNGLMGAVSDVILELGGKVTGIIPQFMVDAGWLHPSLSEVIVTVDMHTRKRLMAEKSDVCLALPGGIGTMEELLEIITWKQLGLYHKPIIILNFKGYYNPLLKMFQKAANEQFLHHHHQSLWYIANCAEKAMDIIKKWK